VTTQLERTLHLEIAYRLKRYPVVLAAIPNGLFIPSRDEAERNIAARIIRRMKSDSMLTPGAADMVLVGAKGALFLELKRPSTRDLFTVRPKGRLSPEQREFQSRCAAAGVRYVVAYDWADVECSLGGLW
jgi:hypothetical protein